MVFCQCQWYFERKSVDNVREKTCQMFKKKFEGKKSPYYSRKRVNCK